MEQKKKKKATMEQYSHLQTVEYCGFVVVFKVYIFFSLGFLLFRNKDTSIFKQFPHIR